jgi:calmodulin
VDFNEFLSLIVPTQKETPENNLLQAFRAFDVNGDGYISREELKEGLQILGEAITEADLNELIQQIDSDNDGQIHYAGMKRHLTIHLTEQ